MPSSIKPKARITVKVIGVRAQSEMVLLTIDSIRASDRIFDKEPGGGGGEKGRADKAVEPVLEVIKELSVDAADDTGISAPRIRYQLADSKALPYDSRSQPFVKASGNGIFFWYTYGSGSGQWLRLRGLHDRVRFLILMESHHLQQSSLI